jgi:transcriptional regulator with XRE-family HTH domain
MVRNENKYNQALEFRKRGFTLAEIAKICDVSKGTVSKWFKNNVISESITKQNKKRAGQENAKRLKLMSKARGAERAARYREAARSADTEYRHYKASPLFIAGLMLYLTQGDMKDKRQIRLSGTEQKAHKIFIRFATEYLGVPKDSIHFWILLYQGQSEEQCMKRWKAVTTLPYSQFYKNQYTNTKKTKQTLHNGVGNTIIGSTVLKHKLIKWIELVQKDLTNK